MVEQLDEDPGLEEALVNRLKSRNPDDDVSEEFKLAVLSLMKTLNLSEKKLDDLRYWIQDMLRRGMDLSKIRLTTYYLHYCVYDVCNITSWN